MTRPTTSRHSLVPSPWTRSRRRLPQIPRSVAPMALVLVGVAVTLAFVWMNQGALSTVASAQSAGEGLKPPLTLPPLFPQDNVWNTPIDSLPVHPKSETYVQASWRGDSLHPDFGTVYRGAPNGIPYNLVRGDYPRRPVTFRYDSYARESDVGPYPLGADLLIEGGFWDRGRNNSDRHLLVVDVDNRRLYELFNVDAPTPDGKWVATSGAIWDLRSNSLRPDGWTSADAAGLPILPGLVRYDEVASGQINHALRVTLFRTQAKIHWWPARHWASDFTGDPWMPMGARLRLKADFDISKFSSTNQVILKALKRYGMFVADNGGNWFISGAPDPRWNNDDLHHLKRVPGSAFEVVDSTRMLLDPKSGQSRP
jgi:hypothetical protein